MDLSPIFLALIYVKYLCLLYLLAFYCLVEYHYTMAINNMNLVDKIFVYI